MLSKMIRVEAVAIVSFDERHPVLEMQPDRNPAVVHVFKDPEFHVLQPFPYQSLTAPSVFQPA
jgi:hypothetical protein